MSVNRVTVSGNLTRDPEERRTKGGMCIMEVGIAVNDRRKNSQTGDWEDYANFLECTMYGSRAEGIIPHLAKGMHVTIDGSLRQERWERDGQKHSRIKVIIAEIDFSGNRRQEQPEPEPQPEPKSEVYDEDIPF